MEQTDKEKDGFSWDGADYRIKVYPDEDREKDIYVTAYDRSSLPLDFKDMNFDGNMDMLVLYAEGMAHMDVYNIYFGDEEGYSSEDSIKEFMCTTYHIYEEVRLIQYQFMAYGGGAGTAYQDSLCYFEKGDYVPVRQLF